MKYACLGAMMALVLAAPANAQLFANGDAVQITYQNSPDSGSVNFPIGVGPVAIGSGLLSLTITDVAAGGGKEWLVFQYQVTNPFNGPLSQPGQNWAVNQISIPALVDVNFIADFTQFTNEFGVPFNQTASIFGQTLMATPVPGLTGNGEGNFGFVVPFPAGPLPSLGALASPFNIVDTALGTTGVYGFTQALEFESQTPVTPGVPEPETWVMAAIGFVGLGYIGVRRRPAARVV